MSIGSDTLQESVFGSEKSQPVVTDESRFHVWAVGRRIYDWRIIDDTLPEDFDPAEHAFTMSESMRKTVNYLGPLTTKEIAEL